jgi:hypothetical protein
MVRNDGRRISSRFRLFLKKSNKLRQFESMKLKTILMTAALVIAAMAHANASAVDGDVIFGVAQVDNTTSYQVSLGSISTLLSLSAGSTLTWNISTSDLATIFGTNWANDSTVRWGAAASLSVAGSSLTVGSTTYAQYSAWSTQLATTVKNPGSSAVKAAAGSIGTIVADMQFATVSSNDSSAYTIDSSISNYTWSTTYGANAAVEYGSATYSSFEGLKWAVAKLDDSDSSTLALYYFDVSATKNTLATLVGTFTLDDDGTLTFTAVPEPSTYAMLGLGALALLRFARRTA